MNSTTLILKKSSIAAIALGVCSVAAVSPASATTLTFDSVYTYTPSPYQEQGFQFTIDGPNPILGMLAVQAP